MATKNGKKRKDDYKAKKTKTSERITFDVDPDLIAPPRGLR